MCAVYGDNFFKRSQYTVVATLQQEGAADCEKLQATERYITEKRAELLAFEKDFKRARAEFEAVRLPCCASLRCTARPAVPSARRQRTRQRGSAAEQRGSAAKHWSAVLAL